MIIHRCAALLCVVLLATAAGCDTTISKDQETDAEVACREEGYDIESDAYNDCVEEKSKSN